MNTTIKVPAAPDGYEAERCWRRRITGLDLNGRGAYAVLGDPLDPADETTLPAGSLLLQVDRQVTGYAQEHGTGRTYPLTDAALTVHLVTDDGTLQALWSRHYKTNKGAFGAATMKKLAALLDAHPAPAGPVNILAPATRRKPKRDGLCRHCGQHTTIFNAHQVTREADSPIEHWARCPDRTADNGTPCALCGITVSRDNAAQVLDRATGQWKTQHHSRLNCTTARLESREERLEREAAALAAQNAARLKKKKAEAARLLRAQARAEAAKKAHDAEQERVKSVGVRKLVKSETLFDKGIGGSERAQLVERTYELTDGTTTLRWWVGTYYGGSGATGHGDYDPDPGRGEEYTDKAVARGFYQDYKFDPTRHRGRAAQAHTSACPTPYEDHCGHCGTTKPEDGGWMAASLGRACSADCYDAMADGRGDHDRRYH